MINEEDRQVMETYLTSKYDIKKKQNKILKGIKVVTPVVITMISKEVDVKHYAQYAYTVGKEKIIEYVEHLPPSDLERNHEHIENFDIASGATGMVNTIAFDIGSWG